MHDNDGSHQKVAQWICLVHGIMDSLNTCLRCFLISMEVDTNLAPCCIVQLWDMDTELRLKRKVSMTLVQSAHTGSWGITGMTSCWTCNYIMKLSRGLLSVYSMTVNSCCVHTLCASWMPVLFMGLFLYKTTLSRDRGDTCITSICNSINLAKSGFKWTG